MFGWTFMEYNEQPADEVLQYMNLYGIAQEILSSRSPNEE